jgi:hypothetical protein
MAQNRCFHKLQMFLFGGIEDCYLWNGLLKKISSSARGLWEYVLCKLILLLAGDWLLTFPVSKVELQQVPISRPQQSQRM